MDAGFLNFHKEEDFTSDFLDSYGDNSESYEESPNPFHLSWDSERELNGDIGLIPIPSQMDFLCPISNSPPFREDINKIMTEWNQMDDFINPATFDITQYIEQPEEPKPRLGGKRIDMENRRYVIEDENKSESEDEVDVETLSDNTSQPILEAGNLNSLLEQFEASETANLEIHNGHKIGDTLFEPEIITANFDIKPEDDLKLFPSPEDLNTLTSEEDFKVVVDDLKLDIKILSSQDDLDLINSQDDLKFLNPQDDLKFLTTQDDLKFLIPQDELKFLTPQDELQFSDPILKPEEIDFDLKLPENDLKLENPQDDFNIDEIKHSNDLKLDLHAEDASFQNDLKLDLKIFPQEDLLSPPIQDDFKLSPQKTISCISPIKTPKKISKICNITKEKPPEKRKIVRALPEMSCTTNEKRLKDPSKNKQILESLPQELIDRIRQSCKRKPLQIIPPIVPCKKKIITPTPQTPNKMIHIDHDYCSNTPRKDSSVSSHKDSGFSSCEEDDRSILKTQPTVKNADGKLMVSLLKTNTIKKKLNLEEYKKRLQNRSKKNSPAPTEDENMRRVKHQEKLMQLAQESIEQQNNKNNPPPPTIEEVTPTPPSNIIMKTLVSVATNTIETWGHLQDIIQKIDNKIQPNSLISSIVEHLPKITSVITNDVEQGHDKTIVYLDKKVVKPKMVSVQTQTIFSSIDNKILRKRSDSTDSNSSSSSYSSCSTRSRTPSPIRRKNQDEMDAVEERRVIYVGRIANTTTREDLRKRFSKFGEITNVSVHFRRRADNYGFVTFLNKEDAFKALEHGNDDPSVPEYDLSFGGRRLFCQTTYADLDNVHDSEVFWSPVTNTMIEVDTTFDALLKEAQAKIKKRQL